MHQPLYIENIHNMSLENYSSNNERPHLVAQFSCDYVGWDGCTNIWTESDHQDVLCCAAIKCFYSTNITLKGIRITLQTPGMSGITLHHVLSLKIHLITTCNIILDRQYGIVVRDVNMVEVYSTDTANYSRGFVFQFTSNTFITNIMATYNNYQGIYLYETTNITIISPKAKINDERVWLLTGSNTTIIDAVVMHNSDR